MDAYAPEEIPAPVRHTNEEINKLLFFLEQTSYMPRPPPPIPVGPITTKEDMRAKEKYIKNGDIVGKTSGSTGIPVIVPKTPQTVLWHSVSNKRDLLWRKWITNDPSKKILVISPNNIDQDEIGEHKHVYTRKINTIDKLQKDLEKIQPSYLFAYPTIIAELDLTKVPIIDVRSSGELGATSYSCEEAGVIALKCEYGVYHIMEILFWRLIQN